jgi:mevalonate kinase
MSVRSNKQYHAKLLLFGEYGILIGSPALSVPFRKFSGQLVLPDRKPLGGTLEKRSNNILRIFGDHIQNSCRYEISEFNFQFDLLKDDLENGLYFKSNIPNGYGVGSSGALTAAIFDSYSKWDILNNTISDIKIILGLMESFFHKKSSGMDPLTSLMDSPVHISGDGQISAISSAIMAEDPSIYLIDSGKKGKTGNYVANFLQQSQNPVYRQQVIEPYSNYIRICLDSLLAFEDALFFDNLRLLSEHQYKYFLELIPSQIRKVWKFGLDNDHFYLKLCGSGGGGFTLAFLRDKGFNLTEYLNRESLESIPFTT